MTERGGAIISFCRILAPPNDPPPPIPKYFTILMTEMRDAINFVGFWRSRHPPSNAPSPDATILNYLNDSEGGGAPLSFVRFWRPPPLPDATILNYLNDREWGGGGGGAIIICRILASPNDPPPQMTQYLTILMTERGGPPLCRILTPPPYESKILYYLNDRDEGLLFL